MRTAPFLALIGLAALVAPGAVAEPFLSYTTTDLGSKVGFTVAINWNDAVTASGYFALDASGTNGSAIQQQNALGTIVINTEADANIFGGIDPAYIKAQDSWWYVGEGAPFANPVPPYNGVSTGTGNIGSNLYQASWATFPNTPVSGSTNILNLVLSKTGNEANGRITGGISRTGVDYFIDFPLNYVGIPESSLGVNPDSLVFGSVRVGTSAEADLTVTNTGPSGFLSGAFGGASGEFGPGGVQNFGSLTSGVSAMRNYTYTPSARGGDAGAVTITSDATVGATDAVVPLSGVGVGPVFGSSQPAGSTIAFDISLTAPASSALTVSNTSADDDGGNTTLTDLTLVNVALSGLDAAAFDVEDLTSGDVISKGQSQAASVVLGASRNYRPRSATLTLATDEGAALGGNGAHYSYQVVAAPQTSGIWQSLAGGAWETASHWSLNSVPAPSEIARFSLEGDYTVTLAGNRSQAGLIVTNDDVRLDLNAHALSLAGELIVGDLATSLGRLTVQDGAASAASVQLGLVASADGRLDIVGGAALQTGSAYVGGTASSSGGAGTLAIAAGASLTASGPVKVWPGGTLLVDGTATAPAGLELSGGTLTGGGAVTATLFNSGIVDPSGELALAGIYVQSPSGVLAIELDDDSHDALHVSNLAILSGGLEVAFADGFSPAYGDVFEVLTFGSRSGQFASITGPEFAPGRSMLPVYSATALTLYAITPGDANGDGYVTPADYTIWADNFGLGPGATILDGDFNLDGFVNGADFTLWADNYTGLPPGGAMAVPEPSVVILSIIGFAFVPLLLRRLHRGPRYLLGSRRRSAMLSAANNRNLTRIEGLCWCGCIAIASTGCPVKRALGGLIVPISVQGVGTFNNSTSLISDGVLPPRKTTFHAPSNVWWSGLTPAFTLDLGGAYTVEALTIDVDNNDDYLVEGSVDGSEYSAIFLFHRNWGPVPIDPGGMEILTTDPSFPVIVPPTTDLSTPSFVGTEFDPVEARYLRVRATGGDDAYSVGELQAFGQSTRLPGDGNGDGFVTPADYTIWADNFGLGPGATLAQGDFNLDGFVNGADYTLWADHYTGLPPGGALAVPEPTSAVLAIIAALLLAAPRIRGVRRWSVS